MPDRLMSVAEVAEYLGIPVATLYRWRVHNDGPRGIRVGKYVRYRPAVVEAWLDEHYAVEPRPAE